MVRQVTAVDWRAAALASDTIDEAFIRSLADRAHIGQIKVLSPISLLCSSHVSNSRLYIRLRTVNRRMAANLRLFVLAEFIVYPIVLR